MSRRRDAVLLADTAVSSITNAGVLYVAARFVDPSQLGFFSFVLLLAAAGVALQRAGFLTPALTSQRVTGRSYIPLHWAVSISLPVGVGVGMGVGVGVAEEHATSSASSRTISMAAFGMAGKLGFGYLSVQDYRCGRLFTVGGVRRRERHRL